MKNKKGNIGSIIMIVIILGATIVGMSYFIIKKIFNKSVNTRQTNSASNIQIPKNETKVSTNDYVNNYTNIISTVLIFDASGSMSQHIIGGPRMDIAKKAVIDYAKNLNKDVNLSIIAYGHKGDNTQSGKRESCNSVEEIYYMGHINNSIITSKINTLNSNGWAPITTALQKAEKILSKTESKIKYILLLSDGKETCDLNPVTYAKELKKKGITVDVIGIGVDNKAKIQLNNISINSGGEYFSVNSDEDFLLIIDNINTKVNSGNISIDLSNVDRKY